MKDERGVYYYPFPQNKRVRTYVREADGAIWFRLWNEDDRELWNAHGWVPYGAIKEAMAMFGSGGFDPTQAYDLQVARMVLEEEARNKEA
jgi:hypothetical protein